MKRVPPSEQIRQEISSLLSEGIKGDGSILTELVTKAVQRVLQEALEQELTDHLGRDHYERRREEEPHRGYRNGYEPKRVKTAEEEVQVKVPQVKESLERVPAGKPVELVFSLYPISYRFHKGNRIRITAAFTDADNFETPVIDPAPKIQLLRDMNHPSFIQLPMVESR